MSGSQQHNPLVGNEFAATHHRPEPLHSAPSLPFLQPNMPAFGGPFWTFENHFMAVSQDAVELLQRSSIVMFSLFFLLISLGVVELGGSYLSSRAVQAAQSAVSAVHPSPAHIAGLNETVANSQADSTLTKITSQHIAVSFGAQTTTLTPATIKQWLKVSADSESISTSIHVDETAINAWFQSIGSPYIEPATDQVTVTHDGIERVILAGHNGTQLGDITSLSKQIAVNLLSAKGMQLTAPVVPKAAQAVTPTAFEKFIEVDVNNKVMYLYDKGNLTRSYLISAGAPETPTPIGEFKTFSKLPVQDMRGYNANDTPYFQPHVRWISYFKAGGFAIHGNYWRPYSWFGYRNSSHGCVSLPDAQAEWVYNWAPVGTTIVTYKG